jgi:hypothetical protein
VQPEDGGDLIDRLDLDAHEDGRVQRR